MKTLASIAATLLIVGCAHHDQVARKPAPPPRMSPATSSAIITGEPRASDSEDPATVQTTGAEIRAQEPKPAAQPRER